METEDSLDELLCRSIVLFCQCRLYGGGLECELQASSTLEEARQLADGTKDGVHMAKWGCVVECLAQKFYISDDTDRMLGDIDNYLISCWKTARKSTAGVFSAYLWFGYYFLLRFRNGSSRVSSRSRHAMSDILSSLTEIFRKLKKEPASGEVLALFPTDVWGETVYWAELVCDSCICERQSAVLLGELYDLKRVELQQGGTGQNILLQKILEFYCF